MSDERRDERPASDGDGGRERWIDRMLQRFSLRSRDSVRDDLEEVVAEAAEAGDFSAQEQVILNNVLAFHRVRVSDVMVPRADIAAVPAAISLGELLGIFRAAGHSRLPTYGETLDEPLGMIHIRDLVDYIADRAAVEPARNGEAAAVASLGGVDLSAPLATAEILRPVLFVPPSMPAIDLLARMQASRTHIALVIDEYGGTGGLVSMEDLVEAVVGDIEDEHDETADEIVPEERGTFLVDARARLEDVSGTLGQDLAAGQETDEIDTLGGLIVTLAGRVPIRGEIIAGPGGLEFEVMDADPRRLKRVRIHRRAREPETRPAQGEPGDAPGTGPPG